MFLFRSLFSATKDIQKVCGQDPTVRKVVESGVVSCCWELTKGARKPGQRMRSNY